MPTDQNCLELADNRRLSFEVIPEFESSQILLEAWASDWNTALYRLIAVIAVDKGCPTKNHSK